MKIIIVFVGFLFFAAFLSTEAFARGPDLPNYFGIIVYPNQGWYTAKDLQGNIIINSNIPEAVIKAALDKGGDIYIAGGTYQLSKDFKGLDLKTGTHLKLAQDAKIVVPSGYDGYVFRFSGVTSDCIMEGGSIYEASPIKRAWIGIIMQAGSIYFNLIENMVITNPYIVIDFNGTEDHYINANTFVNIQGFTFVRGVQFDFNGNPLHGIYGNTFRDLRFEAGPMTTYGIKDIRHANNVFYNVQIWDLPPGSHSATIHPSAKNTIIIGGQMTHYGFIDNGKKTMIFDAWHSNIPANSTLLSSMFNVTFAQPMLKDNNATIGIAHSSGSNTTLYTQIKTDAKYWAQNKISDHVFGTSIQYLIKIGIIEKTNESQTPMHQYIQIPHWFKKNAEWWADGQISAIDFISSIQYLLNTGIIQLS